MDSMFTLLPMSQTISLEAGEVYHGSVTVSNPADAVNDFYYKAGVSPYGVVGEEYTADLATESDRTQIVDWITIEEPSGSLKPNEVREIKFTITVPETAPAGGQYAAITVASDSDSAQDSGVSVHNIFEMGSVIYADVAGEDIHDGAILDNHVPGFVLSTPVDFAVTLNNNGNIHETATVSLSIKDAITGNQIIPSDEDPGTYTEYIMPETTRLISRNVDNLPIVGVVNVTQKVFYNGDVSEVEQTMVICPIWFMVTVAVAIGALMAIVARAIIKRKRKKAWA